MKKRAGLLFLFFVLTTLSALLITCTALSVTDFLQLIFPTEGASSLKINEGNPVMVAVGSVYEALARLEPMRALTLYAILLFLLYGFKNLFSYLSIVIFSKIRISIVSEIRERLHAAVMQQNLSQWSSQQQGQWLSRMTNDIAEYEDNVLDSIRMFITAVTSMLIYVFMLLYLDWRLTLMVVVVMGVGALLLSSSRRLKRQGRKLQEIGGELTTTTQETLDSLKEIKAATAIEYVNRRQREQNERFTRLRIKLYRKLFAASPLSDFLGNMIVVAILIIGAFRVLGADSSMSAAMFVSYIIIYVLMLAPIKDFSNAIAQIKKGRGVEQRFSELISDNVTSLQHEKTKITNTISSLEFRNLSFSYGDHAVIDQLSMSVPIHSHTAIIGESGSGKTTFGRLVTGLLEQQSGEILINGKPTSADERRGLVAYIPQEPMLFNDTVEGNIRFGREWLSDDDISQSVNLAQVEPILHSLLQGMQSEIGDGGGRLSGGERQRISIARALAGNPDILVMDEATAALDAATEQNITQQIRETLAGRTVIVIAHRASTIAACDNVFDISRQKWVRVAMMIGGMILCGNAHAACVDDTIPLQAQQTGFRTVELTWNAGDGTTSLYRQYPGETTPIIIATTEGSSWTDHHSRCVCDDTVRYSIVRGSEEGYAAVMVSDNAPTAMAEWGIVTVEDEQVKLNWKASIDDDIMGYLICEGNPSVVVDTVFGQHNTNYTYTADDALSVHHFRLCAFDSCRQASPLTDACNNIVLSLDADPCSRSVQAGWNGYENMPSGVGSYELWASEDGAAFRRVAQTDAAITQASFDVSESCINLTAFIKVISVDGQSEANSNRVSVQFLTVERPAYFYLRKVSVAGDGKSVNILAQTDPSFAGTDYRLYRTVADRPASVVAHLSPSSDGTLSWTDTGVDPTSEPCGYYLGVDDGCGRNEMRTAMGYTILPQLLTEGESLVLRWDAYNGWTGSTRYQVISSPLDKDNWELDGDTWETVYQLANNAGIRRYKVLAFEGSNSEYQRDDSLQSVQVYHRPHTDIWLPNAFTPTETSNNTFFPSAQYINPEGYSFTIFNRQGMMLFSTTQTDAFWDGRYNGVIQPNGVYVYKITFRQNDGTDQYLMGTVMLIR